jgi:hypothetical protein
VTTAAPRRRPDVPGDSLTRTRTTLLALALAGTALAAPAAADPATVSRDVTGLLAGGTALVTFDSADVGTVSAPVAITGLAAGESVAGIDYRPATGDLYGLVDSATGQRLVVIDASTGSTTPVGPLTQVATGAISIDFNPTVDRLRVVSSTGDNLRVDPNSGATTRDGGLNYGPGTGSAQGIAAAAYTNSDNDCSVNPVPPATGTRACPSPTFTGTQLFDLDAALDQLALQDPPNTGGLKPVGPVEQDLSAAGTGFDIHTPEGGGNEGFVSLSKNGKSRLFTIDVAVGVLKPAGKIGADVVDIALPVGQ